MDTGVAPTNASFMSAPAAKALSLPVSTITRIAVSSSSSRIAMPNSVRTSSFSAFSTCGRFSRTIAIAPSFSMTTVFGMLSTSVA